MYPLIMSPFFRHGAQTPWGGDMLRDLFLKDAPETTGEALEVSALPGMESVIANGALCGQTLAAAHAKWGEALTGAPGAFPLLIKLLDAKEMLSVQVHPGDEYALARENKRGKTEAWVVLSCEEGARIAYGVSAGGRSMKEIIEAGDVENALNWVSVRPGDVLYIPAGTVHALGGGIQCYEIQQSSDVTYRIWDWGRGRELHIKQAEDVCRLGDILPKCEGATVICKGGSRTYFICDENFELCRLNVSGSMPIEGGRMRAVTALGGFRLEWDGGEADIAPFTTFVVPAALESARLIGSDMALMSSVSDRAALSAELGYRAENVAGLTREV